MSLLQEHSVLNEVFNLQHWQEAGLWEDPCLRIGWIQGLRSMLQHPKALSFFVQSGDSLTQLLFICLFISCNLTPGRGSFISVYMPVKLKTSFQLSE